MRGTIYILHIIVLKEGQTLALVYEYKDDDDDDQEEKEEWRMEDTKSWEMVILSFVDFILNVFLFKRLKYSSREWERTDGVTVWSMS